MNDKELELLIRSFDDDLDTGDRLVLDRVLDRSAEARTERVRLTRVRAMVAAARADSFDPLFADRVMAGLDDLSRAPSAPAQKAAERAARPRSPRRAAARPWRAAAGFAAASAAVVLVAVLAIALWLQPRTVAVPYGSVQTVELADGSLVELSSGSRLTFSNFVGRDERRVELEGEAFFDVSEAERPFIVETFNASVSVLGTRFNVRAWPRDPIPETSVTLASGSVKVEALQAPQVETLEAPADEPESATAAVQRPSGAVVLEPGQSTSVVRDSTAVREPTFVSLDHAIAWRSGGLAFVDQPVGSVFTAIERRFNVDVEVSQPAIQERLLTYLNPQPDSAEEVLSDVCHTLDLRYRRTANGFAVLPSTTR